MTFYSSNRSAALLVCWKADFFTPDLLASIFNFGIMHFFFKFLGTAHAFIIYNMSNKFLKIKKLYVFLMNLWSTESDKFVLKFFNLRKESARQKHCNYNISMKHSWISTSVKFCLPVSPMKFPSYCLDHFGLINCSKQLINSLTYIV